MINLLGRLIKNAGLALASMSFLLVLHSLQREQQLDLSL